MTRELQNAADAGTSRDMARPFIILPFNEQCI
jgi:hypothetical protein